MPIDRLNRAGRYTDRIVIEDLIKITDSVGQQLYGSQAPQGAWNSVFECWAHIEDAYGIEQKQSGKEVNEEWVVIQVRYAPSLRDTIQPKMRIRHKNYGTIYDIRSVLVHVDGERKIIEMTCLLVR